MRLRLCFVLCVLVASSLHAAATIEQLLSSPYPSNLIASRDGSALAWIENENGVRNIWIAEAPQFKARRVTRYDRDDGQALSSLVFTPDAASLFYVRGGSTSPAGDQPNPTSDPEGVDQAIWRVASSGATEPEKFAVGAQPAISPNGSQVAFLLRGDVIVVPITGGDVKQIARDRGRATQLRWSPDGKKVAFVSERGSHSFVAIYDVAKKTLRFLDPKIEADSDPVWSPDSRRVAFIRNPVSTQLHSFRPTREFHPWAIVVADAESGRGREIWRADRGRGSYFFPIEADDQLRWLADDSIVFPWEKHGWLQLHAIAAAGGQARLLTPGAFEVEHVNVSHDRREVIYSSNQNDIDRRHLWRVMPSGKSAPLQLTRGGIEWAPVAAGAGRIAFLRSSAKSPARPALLTGEAMRDLRDVSNYPSTELMEPAPVELQTADGLKIRGQLFKPRGNDSRRRPAVIFFHGGSRRQMFLGFHNRGYYHRAYAFNQYLASRGYVVLSVNYRSGVGYGLEFREATGYGASGASEFNDVVAAGEYLRSRADVDPNKIGLWGGSYGGYLTALGLARRSDMFAAGVDLHGVHDWNLGIQIFETYDPKEHPDAAKIARESSPIASADTWRSPVLLIHGDDDRNVSFKETVVMYEALRDRGVEVEQLVFPDEVHDFLVHAHWLEAYNAAADFFERKLKE